MKKKCIKTNEEKCVKNKWRKNENVLIHLN